MTILILIVLGTVGLITVFASLSSLIIKIRRHPCLLRIKGTVVTSEKEYSRDADAQRRVMFYPIINYTTPDGRQVRFRSRTGSTHEELILAGPNVSPWRDGQSIDVFHDPYGTMEPCIASLWSLYSGSSGFLVGGVLLLIVVVNKCLQLAG